MGDIANVKIGGGFVRFKSVDLGYTKGGIEVDISSTVQPSGYAQDGANPRALYLTGRMAKIRVPLAESQIEQLDRVLENVTFTDVAGVQTSVVSGATGTNLMTLAGELVVGHLDSGGSFVGASKFYKAVVIEPIKFAYRHDAEKVIMVTFTAYPDAAQSDDLFEFVSTFTP